MPRKIRELIEDLKRAGFIDRGGKGSHRNFIHPNLLKPITISGKLRDDVLLYQEKAIKQAIKEVQL
jgi:predicted RNA binding protein YcfA (HicA-like mRNA interferase family)